MGIGHMISCEGADLESRLQKLRNCVHSRKPAKEAETEKLQEE